MLSVCLNVENVYQGSFNAALEDKLPPSPEPRWQDLDREEGSSFFLWNLDNKANLRTSTPTHNQILNHSDNLKLVNGGINISCNMLFYSEEPETLGIKAQNRVAMVTRY